MPASLEEMFQKQLNNPNETIGQQYSYLKDMGMVPQMSLEYLSPGTEGQYSNWENTLKINPQAGSPINAFSHELQHAVDAAHARQYTQVSNRSDKNPDDYRFMEAIKKFDAPSNIPKGDLNSYRAARNERQAYGVANMNYKGGEYNGTPHMDSTEATEQAILHDLAKRSLKGKPAVKSTRNEPDVIDKVFSDPVDLVRSMFTRK